MKKLFVAVLAIAGLVACNTEETVRVQGPAPIAFDGSFVETRALAEDVVDPSITTENITGFDVWGFMDEAAGQIFNGEDVTGKKGNFTYANTQYWVPGHKYYFAAISPMNSKNIVLTTPATTDATKGLGVVDFTVTDGTEDFLYSAVGPIDAPEAGATEVAPVKFEFNHMLSKVKFTFTNGFDNDLAKIDVTNVRMVVPSKGTIKLDQEDWWSTNQWVLGDETVELAFGAACTKLAKGHSEFAANERIVLPADATQKYAITFDVVYYQGDVKAYSGTKNGIVENVALEIGKAYNFKVELNAKNIMNDGSELLPIVFDVEEVKTWENGGDVPVVHQITLDETRTETLVIAENTILDLNGKTWNSADYDAIIVAEGATLTIVGDGTIETKSGNDGYPLIVEGTLIINGGTFKSGVDQNGEPNAVVYARGNGQVYVNGGNFPNDNVSKYVLNKKDADRATTTIEVRGGVFENFDPSNNTAEGAGTNFLAPGYKVVANGTTYTVVAE